MDYKCNNIKSEIGEIVSKLWNDKIGKIKLKGKERCKLQKRLDFIKSSNIIYTIKVNIVPGIYDVNGCIIPNPIPYEIEILKWNEKEFYEQ